MRTFIATILVCGLGWATAAGAAPSYTVGGRITFSGRVLTPTCAVNAVRPASESASSREVQACKGALDPHSKSVTAFTTDAMVIANTHLPDDAMLQYLVKNLPAGHQARRITRTYR